MRFLLIILLAAGTAYAQDNVYGMQPPDEEFENISVLPLKSDTLVSSFLIWVKKEVAPHKHNTHSEHIIVLSGMAEILLGKENIIVGPGDMLFIPKGTMHAVKVLSGVPLKVISIQAPKFNNKDREEVPLVGDYFQF